MTSHADTAHFALREIYSGAVAPGEKLVSSGVRMVLDCWNYEEDHLERRAGAAWVRRRWDERPEPTLLIGFESEQEFRTSQEGSLLDLPGIVYLEMPVASDPEPAVRQAAERVRTAMVGTLDDGSRSRNRADLIRDLRAWRHGLVGRWSQAQGAAAVMKAGRAGAAWAEAAAIIRTMSPAQADRQRLSARALAKRCAREAVMPREPFDEMLHRLDRIVEDWRHLHDFAGRIPDGHDPTAAASIIGRLLDDVDRADALIAEIVRRLEPQQPGGRASEAAA